MLHNAYKKRASLPGKQGSFNLIDFQPAIERLVDSGGSVAGYVARGAADPSGRNHTCLKARSACLSAGVAACGDTAENYVLYVCGTCQLAYTVGDVFI